MAAGCSKTLTDDQRQALAKRLAGVRERRWKKAQRSLLQLKIKYISLLFPRK
jgi:hypothetical protein